MPLSFKSFFSFSFRFFTTTTTSTFSPPTTTVGRNGSELWKRVTAKSNVFIMINICLVTGISSVRAICLLFYFFFQTEIKNNNLVAKYHPNFWMDGKWRCCQQSEKLATGCQVYNPLGYGTCRLNVFRCGIVTIIYIVYRLSKCVGQSWARFKFYRSVTHTEAKTTHSLILVIFSTASKKPLPQIPDPQVSTSEKWPIPFVVLKKNKKTICMFVPVTGLKLRLI